MGWSGSDQKDFVSGGLDRNTPGAITRLIVQGGFNCIRMPFTVEMVLKNPKVSSERLDGASWLKGKRALGKRRQSRPPATGKEKEKDSSKSLSA